MKRQRGGFAVGLIIGLLCGLLLALGVALYIAKVPIPFVDKVPHRTAEQDAAEAERNKSWDPNAPLSGKPGQLPPPPGPASSTPQATAGASGAEPPASAPRTDVATPAAPPRDPAAILSGQPPAPEPAASAAAPFIYFVQAGAWSRVEDAEQQRASLAMLGITARLSEREQNGRTVHRVRVGPFATKEEAESSAGRLRASGSEATLVRVDRPRP